MFGISLRLWHIWAILFFLLLFSGPVYFLVNESLKGQHWSTAETGSANIAPHPSAVKEAVAQVYAARTWGARGSVAVHTWIAVKPTNADNYTVYQKIGWRIRWAGTTIVIREDIPDRYWYGNRPELLAHLQGDGVDETINKIHKAALSYPHPHEYRIWPGPNSNSFIAWIARRVPELRVDLPPTAIGKDWLGSGQVIASAPSGTGFQVTLWGALGVTLGIEEGIEFNIGCVHFGIDPLDLALRLPGFGNVGLLPRRSKID